jgi:molybdopterin molybdotransferase
MLTPAQASSKIMAALRPLDTQRVPLADACGRVLRENVTAERDQPPFDRVMMDGIALAYRDIDGGMREFPVQATLAAGAPAMPLESGHAIEIMTGAPLPAGADCIVPVERIEIEDNRVRLEDGYRPEAGQFIHARGSDYGQGAQLLPAGTRIGPLEVAIIASAGLAEVAVSAAPVVSVISTGDELIAAGAPIEAHQVRLSNGPALASMLESAAGADVAHEHLPDEPEIMFERLEKLLERCDALVLSGGVSMGKADHVPDVLGKLGVAVVFHRISQRPGKPMWFGMTPGGTAVFALPGNPVSSLTCCRQYVIPALHSMAGMQTGRPEFAALAREVVFEPQLTNFLPVRLVSNAAAQLLAMPVHTNTSGDFASLAGTDGYVELAADRTRFPSGTPVPLHRWRT